VPFNLDLPEPWASRGWRVKIRDRERLEPPHATILQRTRAWRFDLRSEQFLDKDPDPAAIPQGSRERDPFEPRTASAGVGQDVSGKPDVVEGAG
jgi:hypothetical protein